MKGLDETRQDGALARERGALFTEHGVVARAREAEGIDLESANDARIQAAKVERENVAVEAGRGIEHVPTGARDHGGVASDIGRDDPASMHARQVEVIEGGHRAALAVHR